MDLPALDLYILSLLERGLKTPYDLQAQFGLSLGGSVPALKRLKKQDYIRQENERRSGKRLRHCYTLTEKGREVAHSGWQSILGASKVPTDLESTLRLVDIATYKRANQTEVTGFLERASAQRKAMAEQVAARRKQETAAHLSYPSARLRYEEARLLSEYHVLDELAGISKKAEPVKPRGSRKYPLKRRGARNLPPGQATFFDSQSSTDQKG